jgi:hypothetical protein
MRLNIHIQLFTLARRRHIYIAYKTTILANPLIIDNESESVGPMYGLIRQELLLHVATLPWAVHLRNSYDTISNVGEFSESDLAVLSDTRTRDLSDYAGPDVELVVSPVDNEAVSATQSIYLQLPTLSPAWEILGAAFNGALRAFFASGPTLTSWRIAASKAE